MDAGFELGSAGRAARAVPRRAISLASIVQFLYFFFFNLKILARDICSEVPLDVVV